MRKPTINTLLALALVGGLAACDDSSVLGPDDGIEGTIVQLMVDEDLTEALIIDVEAAIAGVLDVGVPSSGALTAVPNPDAADQARALLEQAREKFRQARQAWIGGDTPRAAQLALEGRLLVAEAMVLVLGEEAYVQLLERVDQIITWLEEQVDEEASELLSRIRQLKTEAEGFYADYQGSQAVADLHAAVERLLLAVQIAHRERVHHRRQQIVRHAQHSIFMANMALMLAAEVATPGEFTSEQQRVLRHAVHLRNDAVLALEAGRYRLSLALSRAVVNLSLVVVILDPDLPENPVVSLTEISNTAIADAEAALAASPDEFLSLLLEHVKLVQLRAIQISDTQPRRAVHILWYVAVSARAITEAATVA
ncbi:MAG: hypothetical protein GTO46_05555 [Gemmatimonadetes bacterium]|nr:hypothetical protein [Gemmatimonadota bacterium]NIO31095.1 hypothetical protein [Gemmatimonadota bacterium]